MPTLHLLGTGAGYSEPHRTTTMLAFSDDDSLVVIDCGGDVIHRMLSAGLDPLSLKHLIISHSHPDHVSGFPLMMEKIWLAGRREAIPIYGIPEALDQARRVFAAFDTSGWKGLPELLWHEATDRVLEDDAWEITAAPVVHAVPNIGFRVLSKRTGKVVAYSCDTEPAPNVVKLARNADILVHEATGEGPWHSSAVQAAEAAKAAGAKRLILVHLPANLDRDDLRAAQEIFPDTEWGFELGRYEIG